MNRKELVKTTRYLNDKNINRGSSGNLSYRINNGFVITPSSVPNNKLNIKDVVDTVYFNDYDKIDMHRQMISDNIRTKSFRDFIGFIPEKNILKKEPDWNLGNKLSEFVDRFAYQLDFSLEQKQSFLEEQDVIKRVELLHSILKMKLDLIHLSRSRGTHDPRMN